MSEDDEEEEQEEEEEEGEEEERLKKLSNAMFLESSSARAYKQMRDRIGKVFLVIK